MRDHTFSIECYKMIECVLLFDEKIIIDFQSKIYDIIFCHFPFLTRGIIHYLKCKNLMNLSLFEIQNGGGSLKLGFMWEYCNENPKNWIGKGNCKSSKISAGLHRKPPNKSNRSEFIWF